MGYYRLVHYGSAGPFRRLFSPVFLPGVSNPV